jgi:hypothetical protein
MTAASPAATRRSAIAARLRAALGHPGFLTGLAALAMLGGSPIALLPAAAAAERR